VSDFATPVVDYRLGSRQAADVERGLSDHITALKTAGYTFLSASQVAEAVLKRSRLAYHSVALTFRDDRRVALVAALDAAVAHRVAATAFVAVSRIGRPGALRWDDVGTYTREGIEFQPRIGARCETLRAARELALLRRRAGIRGHLSVAVNDTGRDLSDALASRIGVSAAWGDTPGAVTPAATALRLPRVPIEAGARTRDLLSRLERVRDEARHSADDAGREGGRNGQ
jgi:hypothetical protein